MRHGAFLCLIEIIHQQAEGVQDFLILDALHQRLIDLADLIFLHGGDRDRLQLFDHLAQPPVKLMFHDDLAHIVLQKHLLQRDDAFIHELCLQLSCRHLTEHDAQPVLIIIYGSDIAARPLIALFIHQRPGRHDTDHFTLHESLGQRRILYLFYDRNLISLLDEPLDVAVCRMVRNAAHRHFFLHARIAPGQHKVELQRRSLRVIKKHLIKITEAIKDDRVGILFFHLQIMLHHRGVFIFFRHLHHSIHLVMISDLILSLYHILSIFSESDRVWER